MAKFLLVLAQAKLLSRISPWISYMYRQGPGVNLDKKCCHCFNKFRPTKMAAGLLSSAYFCDESSTFETKIQHDEKDISKFCSLVAAESCVYKPGEFWGIFFII